MIRVTANDYLDRRRPEWLDAEVAGLVRYHWHRELRQGTRLVEISDSRKDIQAAVGAAVRA